MRIILTILIAIASAQKCVKFGGEGPCIFGLCPNGTECIEEVCCLDEFIVYPPDNATATTISIIDAVSGESIGEPEDPDCVDTVDCSGKEYFCLSVRYREIMTRHCAKTCGLCGIHVTSSKPRECKDLAPDCHSKLYFCRNLLYKSLMEEMCQKTCGACPSSSTPPSPPQPSLPPSSTAKYKRRFG